MKLMPILVLCLSSSVSLGQFAIISDTDGYVNVRKNGSKENKILDTLANGHLVYSLEKVGNWTHIEYSKNDKEYSGYIYNDRLTLISHYSQIPILTQTHNQIRLKRDSIEIIITQRAFDRTKHTFTYYKDAKDQIKGIDHKPYWGRDGEMPRTQYASVKIKMGQAEIDLPGVALENLYEPNLDGTQVNYDKEKNIIYVQSMNSDGAGFYEIIWKIENGRYKGRLISYGL